MRTFYNAFPKSGTHLIALHRNIPRAAHAPLYTKPGTLRTPRQSIDKMREFIEGGFTGHVPYSPEVLEYLRVLDVRIVFLYRDLRDVALSLADYLKVKGGNTEFDIPLADGRRMSQHEDVLLECIRYIGGLWPLFEPWLDHADACYRYEELRGAALLLGHEASSLTFSRGQAGAWRREFGPVHLAAAREWLPDLEEREWQR